MEKIKFNSSVYYYFLIIILLTLLIYNIYSVFISHNLFTILPIVIQTFLLILIFIKNISAKLAIKIWSIVFLIIGPLMQLVGKLLKDTSYDFQFFDIKNYIGPFLILLVGGLIFYFAEKTIAIEKE